MARRRKSLGLKGGKATREELAEVEIRQLVLDQLEKDPNRGKGPRLIREAIRFDTGITLSRWVSPKSTILQYVLMLAPVMLLKMSCVHMILKGLPFVSLR